MFRGGEESDMFWCSFYAIMKEKKTNQRYYCHGKLLTDKNTSQVQKATNDKCTKAQFYATDQYKRC